MIAAIIQARMGSTRLGGKVMMKVLGKPLLQHMTERLSHSNCIEKIIIATTTNNLDDQIVELCNKIDLSYYRGSENDVLDRYYLAAKHYHVDIIVRLTSDCPLIDPHVTDRIIRYYLENHDEFDYVSNMHPPTFPDGLDTEVFPFPILERAWMEATKPHEREHVSPYIWDNPALFRIGNILNDRELHLTERWTLDYKEDYCFIKTIYENLYHDGTIFYMDEILQLLSDKPEIRKLNSQYQGENWWGKHWDQLKTKKTLRTRGKS